MMRWLVIALLLFAPSAFAQTFEAGVQHIAVMTGEDGTLDVPLARGFAANVEAFWTPRLSTQFSASFVNPEAILFPLEGGDVDLGTLGMDLYALTARYHLRTDKRLSAFAGAGAALLVLGDLDDRFGEAVQADFDSEPTFLVEAGLRYRFRPRIFVTLSASYAPVTAEPRIERTNVALPAELQLDPLTVAIGASWRF